MLFFTHAVVSDICGFTNQRGWELVLSRPSYANSAGTWDEVTPEEFHSFLGLIIYMGFTSLPNIHRYWGTKSLQGSWAKLFMSRNRFKALLAALHVVDPATENNQDRLTKLRYLMDHLKNKCLELFQPGQHLSIDERMVKSKGRSGFKQYMKGKPVRWGFKLWVIATSDSGYTLDFNIYTGGRDGRVLDLASKVVEELIQPFRDSGHTIWFDNFYTSPTLMVKLRTWGLNACGTCRINHKKCSAESGVEPRLGSYSQIDFRENLSRQLAGISVDTVFQPRPSAPPTTILSSFHQVHVPVQQEPKRNCWLCYKKIKKEHKTIVACMAPECNGV
ncbi:piggyBac transposable element-derived protein 3-like [Alosa alosa]|uniref:piggyBac transposable element-derived protein 3-like n=1 Tax=Alosa alosa TaxID=278164 RepID=UPI00201528E7|nr:piggyBac transposable element-derived protein 3-like [Alosa alosa]